MIENLKYKIKVKVVNKVDGKKTSRFKDNDIIWRRYRVSDKNEIILIGINKDNRIFLSMPYIWNDDELYEKLEDGKKITISNNEMVEVPYEELKKLLDIIDKLCVINVL